MGLSMLLYCRHGKFTPSFSHFLISFSHISHMTSAALDLGWQSTGLLFKEEWKHCVDKFSSTVYHTEYSQAAYCSTKLISSPQGSC